jgi:hypothetical protein
MTPYGLNGTEVRALMNETMAADANIVSSVTYDVNGMIIAAEPFTDVEGTNLSDQVTVQKLLATRMPAMSNVFQVVEGPMGSVFASPVFDSTGRFIGAASVVFNASKMMDALLPSLVNGTSFTFWCMQTDGLDVYDTDLSQVGMNILYGPDYANFPNLQALAWKMLNESTGYGTYHYFATLGSQQVVYKECFWTTIGAHGITWRLVVVHRQ